MLLRRHSNNTVTSVFLAAAFLLTAHALGITTQILAISQDIEERVLSAVLGLEDTIEYWLGGRPAPFY